MIHINLLRKISWSFHKSTGLEWDDLFQESYIAYRYALEHYNPDKGVPISTFLWMHISNQLKTYYQNERKFAYPMENAYRRDKLAYVNLSAWIPMEHFSYENIFECLSEDAIKIADLVLISPSRFSRLKRNDVRNKIIHIMTKRGWEVERIQRSLKELSIVCSNN